MRTYYLDYTVKPLAYPRGAVKVELTKECKAAFPRRAPGSMPGRDVGEALAKLQRWSGKTMTQQQGFTCRVVLEEV